jgi:hypothetical protein
VPALEEEMGGEGAMSALGASKRQGIDALQVAFVRAEVVGLDKRPVQAVIA